VKKRDRVIYLKRRGFDQKRYYNMCQDRVYYNIVATQQIECRGLVDRLAFKALKFIDNRHILMGLLRRDYPEEKTLILAYVSPR
jgi:hypothetical protein